MTTTGELARWASRLDLRDLHRNNPAPSTYLGSSNRRIDFIFGCSQIQEYVASAGTLSYIDGPQSDHRGLFVDIDLSNYLSHDPNSNKHIMSSARALRTGNPELVESYIREMHHYYESHSMEERIDKLYSKFQTMTEASGETGIRSLGPRSRTRHEKGRKGNQYTQTTVRMVTNAAKCRNYQTILATTT
jgi:hypothetical protein